MASKRQKGETSTLKASKAFDKKRFVSEAASERYHNIMAIKSLIPERGLVPHETEDYQVSCMIEERGWKTFVAQPEPAVVAIVREFYANALEAEDDIVMVRGKRVSFSRKHINSYYGLPRIQGIDGYTEYRTKHQNLDEVITTLCQPGAQWTRKDGEAVHFKHGNLSRYGKAWLYFLCAKLWPTTHVFEVTKTRAVILFAIVTGRSINVGRMIHNSILQTGMGKSSGGLPHPSLICGLCKSAKVAWGADEIVQYPTTPIDSRTMRLYKVWSGGESDPRGAGYILPEQSHEVEESPHSADTMPSSPSMALLLAEIRELRHENQELRAELQREAQDRRRDSRRQSRRISHTMQQVNYLCNYTSDFNTVVAQVINNSGFNSDPNAVTFPMAPMFPAYDLDSGDDATADPGDA